MIRTSLVLLALSGIAGAQSGLSPAQPTTPLSSAIANANGGSAGGPCAAVCQSANTACTTGWGAGNTNTFALVMTAGASGDNVCGFSLWTKNATASSVSCFVHLADTAGLPISPAAGTGTMAVGTTYGKYTVTLSAPVSVPAGARYFIAFDNGGMEHPICSAGATQTQYYWHPPVWTTWNGVFSLAWAYEVDCRRCAASATRTFYGTGCGTGPLGVGNTHVLPQLGQNGDLLMRFGPPSGPGVFLIGGVQTSTSLAGIGMPGCTLYTNPLVSLGTSFTAGNATPVPFNIPNELFLCGGTLYVTGAAVWIGQNPLGVITSNAIQLTIGN